MNPWETEEDYQDFLREEYARALYAQKLRNAAWERTEQQRKERLRNHKRVIGMQPEVNYPIFDETGKQVGTWAVHSYV